MERGLQWKTALILVVIVGAFFLLFPGIFGNFNQYLAGQLDGFSQVFIQSLNLNLGLDLQGGIYMVYRIDTTRLPQDLSETDAVDRALEIIRNRIDEFGVREPQIQRTARNRLIVALPGVKDPQRAQELIGKTALLEFKVVEPELQDMAEMGLEGYEKLPFADGQQGRSLVVHEEAKLTGRYLEDARVQIRQQGPTVSLDFDERGAELFGELTANNVNRRIAIVLDNKIISAPRVDEPIYGGQAMISGLDSDQEARDLALLLRAGSLPAPLEQIERRSIGPSLGEDSIRDGLYASIAALVLVMVFMGIYYQLAGLVANITLLLCLYLLMAGLGGLGATLTLPGIAGIILTIGMAVDANVIIFERVKEELAEGKPIRTALDDGFDNAVTAIVDAQVTTIITAVALYWFGTGPVKGFAVTLTLGILATLFSAIFVGKVIFAYSTLRPSVDRLHIGWGNYRE